MYMTMIPYQPRCSICQRGLDHLLNYQTYQASKAEKSATNTYIRSVKVMPCDHAFHRDCIKPFLDQCKIQMQAVTCPICRQFVKWNGLTELIKVCEQLLGDNLTTELLKIMTNELKHQSTENESMVLWSLWSVVLIQALREVPSKKCEPERCLARRYYPEWLINTTMNYLGFPPYTKDELEKLSDIELLKLSEKWHNLFQIVMEPENKSRSSKRTNDDLPIVEVD